MNNIKSIKLLMIISGIVSGLIIVAFMIINHFFLDLELLGILGICFIIIILWIISNFIGIKLILKKHRE